MKEGGAANQERSVRPPRCGTCSVSRGCPRIWGRCHSPGTVSLLTVPCWESRVSGRGRGDVGMTPGGTEPGTTLPTPRGSRGHHG